MRLLRGCGIVGLAGMTATGEVDVVVIYRPLLGVPREMLREYLEEIGQAWREDESNASGDYLRELRAGGNTAADVGGWRRARCRRSGGRRIWLGRPVRSLPVAWRNCFPRRWSECTSRRVQFHWATLREAEWLMCSEAIRSAILHVGGSPEIADFERMLEAVRLVQGRSGGKTVEMGKRVVVWARRGMVVVERGIR